MGDGGPSSSSSAHPAASKTSSVTPGPAHESPEAKAKREKAEDAAKPRVPLARLARLNFPEWPYILAGTVGAAGSGALFPSFAIIFGSLLEVFFIPNEEKLKSEGRFWALVRGRGGSHRPLLLLRGRCGEGSTWPHGRYEMTEAARF